MRFLTFLQAALLLASCSGEQAADDTMNADDALAAEDTRPRFPCEAIENMLATADDCADLTAMAKEVRPGPAALDAPATMSRGRSYEVTLVLDRPKPPPPPPPPPAPPEPADDASNAMDAVTNDVAPDANMADDVEPAAGPSNQVAAAPTANEVAAELPGQDTYFPAQVGRYMTATLTGLGFDIKPISPFDGMQEVARGGQGRWQWEVTPTAEGKRRLTVKTQALGKIDGRFIPLGNGDTAQDVDVTVRPWDRFWDWVKEATKGIDALTALFVALGALIVAIKPIRQFVWGLISGIFRKRRPPPSK